MASAAVAATSGSSRLQLPGHRRARSSSTTTAIQHRPALAQTTSTPNGNSTIGIGVGGITNRANSSANNTTNNSSSSSLSTAPPSSSASSSSATASTAGMSTFASSGRTRWTAEETNLNTSTGGYLLPSVVVHTPTTPNWTKSSGQTSNNLYGDDLEINGNDDNTNSNSSLFSTITASSARLFNRALYTLRPSSWRAMGGIGRFAQKGKRIQSPPLHFGGWMLRSTNGRRSTSSSLSGTSTDDLSHSSPPLSPVGLTALAIDTPSSAGNHAYSPLLFVILLFPLSTALVIGSLWTLPILLPTSEESEGGSQHTVFPKTIAELRAVAWALKGYSETGPWELIHVLGVLAVTALWKHAWSIPGSALLNILTGTLLPPVLATLLQTSLTTLGSLLSTILATPLSPLILRYFPSAVSLTRAALEGPASPASSTPTPPLPLSTLNNANNDNDSSASMTMVNASTVSLQEKMYADGRMKKRRGNGSSTWARLSVLRLIGIVPWSGINIACGVCGVEWWQCAVGAFIGTLPWTAVTCQIGDILQSLVSAPISPNAMQGIGSGGTTTTETITSVLTSPNTIAKLVFLSLVSLAPIVAKDWLSKWLNNSGGDDGEETGDNESAGEEVRVKHRGRRHRKRFSIEWWRRSLSISRSGKEGNDEERSLEEEGRASAEEERIELLARSSS